MKKLFFYFFGFFLFISCSSENNVNNNDLSNKSETGVNMTLKEVLKERATQDEIDFAYSNIIDNRKYNYFKYDSKISLRDYNKDTNNSLEQEISVRWRWGGRSPLEKCNSWIGICFMSTENELVEKDLTPAIIEIKEDSKAKISSLTGENGTTTDGFLPVMTDIHYKDDLYIKKGIYKANEDGSIIVDLINF